MFKVGDKVRVVNDEQGEKEHLIGLVGEIIKFEHDEVNEQDWLVEFEDGDSNDNGDGGWWFFATEIELAEAAPMRGGDNERPTP